MEKKDEFIRVGSTYYKWVEQPLLDGSMVKKYIPWSIEALRQDYGKKFIAVLRSVETNRRIGSF